MVMVSAPAAGQQPRPAACPHCGGRLCNVLGTPTCASCDALCPDVECHLPALTRLPASLGPVGCPHCGDVLLVWYDEDGSSDLICPTCTTYTPAPEAA